MHLLIHLRYASNASVRSGSTDLNPSLLTGAYVPAPPTLCAHALFILLLGYLYYGANATENKTRLRTLASPGSMGVDGRLLGRSIESRSRRRGDLACVNPQNNLPTQSLKSLPPLPKARSSSTYPLRFEFGARLRDFRGIILRKTQL